MGKVYKRPDSEFYWITYSDRGRRFREQAGKSKREADALLGQRMAAVFEGTHFPAKRKTHVTVDQLRLRWFEHRATKRSLSTDKARFAAIVDFFGATTRIATITTEDVDKFRAKLAVTITWRGKPMMVATINRHLALLRSALNLAEREGSLTRNPMRGMRLADERNTRDRVCSPEEYERLIGAARPALRLAIALGFHSAMRRGEIALLRREWIDLEQRVVKIPPEVTKTAKGRKVPLAEAAVAELRTALDTWSKREDGRVFSFRPEAITHSFADLCTRLGIEGLKFHDQRHTAATDLRRGGADVFTIQAITGHKSLNVLKRYMTFTDEDLVDAVDEAARRRAAKKPARQPADGSTSED